MNDSFFWDEEKFIRDLSSLIQIPSVYDETTVAQDAPFGKPIKEAFQMIADLGIAYTLSPHFDQGYAMDLRTGDGDDYIGVLCHADVVPAEESEWDSDPFSLRKQGDFLFGRGVNDDKGPLLLLMQVISQLSKQHQRLKPIRLIIGGAEETSWECVNHYFSKEKQPALAFSPDGDFPIVNHEKGILKVRIHFPYLPDKEIEEIISEEQDLYTCDKVSIRCKATEEYLHFQGERALSRHPERGSNAVYPMLEFLRQRKLLDEKNESSVAMMGRFLERYCSQIFMKSFGDKTRNIQEATVTILSLSMGKDKAWIDLDFRYEQASNEQDFLRWLEEKVQTMGGFLELRKHKPLLKIEENDPLIIALLDAYEKVTKEKGIPMTKGGASYARALNHGVCFGPTFPGEIPNCHMPNEVISLTSFKKAGHIYYEALKTLALQ